MSEALAALRDLLDTAERQGSWTVEQHDRAAALVRRIHALGLVRRWQAPCPPGGKLA